MMDVLRAETLVESEILKLKVLASVSALPVLYNSYIEMAEAFSMVLGRARRCPLDAAHEH